MFFKLKEFLDKIQYSVKNSWHTLFFEKIFFGYFFGSIRCFLNRKITFARPKQKCDFYEAFG
jgi:hypothetical protein